MEIAITVLLLIVGLVLIIKGGDFFVDAAAWMAEASGIPKFIIGCTVENQDRADARLPLFLKLPIRHRTVIAAHGVAFSHHFFFDLKFYEYTEYLSGILRPFAQGFAALGGNHNPADEIVDRTAPTA